VIALLPHQVTADSSKMIDPEFAYVGPIAFDPAKIIAELLIPYFAADGHEAAEGAGSRSGQRAWLLQCIADVWDTFSSRWGAVSAVPAVQLLHCHRRQVCRCCHLAIDVP
jgi:5-methylthioribose kinase